MLEAARRAESEGRDEYALQFYRHLASNFPDGPEGAAAQSALMRLAAQPSFAKPPGTEAHGENGYGLVNPFAAAPVADYGPGFYPPASAPMQNSAPPPPPVIDLPRPVRDYRTARFLAALATWLGGLLVLAGIGLVPLAFVSPRSISGLPLLSNVVAAGPKLGGQLALAGLVQMVLGQLVRALLDQANATRDMAAIARAEAEARNPAEPKTGRRKRR